MDNLAIPIEKNQEKETVPVDLPETDSSIAKPMEIKPEKSNIAPVEIEKPEGMSKDASELFDKMDDRKPQPSQISTDSGSGISESSNPRYSSKFINKISNRLQAKYNRILKRHRRNHKQKISRRKNRKKK